MKNGFYSIHVILQQGSAARGSGVLMFRDGRILGGDAYLFYAGNYTADGDGFAGEVRVERHTGSPDCYPPFDAPGPIAVSVSGHCSDQDGVMRGTTPGQPANVIFTATLLRLADAD